MNQSYADYYKTKLEGALLFQDFVVDVSWQTIGLAIVQYSSKAYQQTVGESRTGVEIKHDEEFKRTGNLWIEIAEKAQPRNGDYAVSGIYREDNAWLYVIGDYDTIFFFPKKTLQQMHAAGERVIENKTKTSKGFLLSRARAEVYACIILNPKAAQKVSKLAIDLAKAGQELHRIVKANPSQGSLLFNPEVSE